MFSFLHIVTEVLKIIIAEQMDAKRKPSLSSVVFWMSSYKYVLHSSTLKMLQFFITLSLSTILMSEATAIGFLTKHLDCGPYAFVCERNNKVRLCEGENLFGPAFLCPPNTVCNEDSSDVCENISNYIDSTFTRTIRCHRNERIADPNVPDCKGYILCIPNKNRFQGIKFKCSGNTVFNGYTRTCSAPDKYRCPVANISKPTTDLYDSDYRRVDGDRNRVKVTTGYSDRRAIECKNYKFSVTQDQTPAKATYFCPSKPVRGASFITCTIFSNQFCITLVRDEEDQFIQDNAAAYRRPRM